LEFTAEGRVAYEESIRVIENLESIPALEWSDALMLTAQDKCQTMAKTGSFAHADSSGQVQQRISKYGQNPVGITAGENLTKLRLPQANPQDHLTALFIDDGVANRLHRVNLLSSHFTQVAISICTAQKNSRQMKKGNSLSVIVYSKDYSANERGKKMIR
jgi:uncharacterized protein YkwD